MHKSKIGAGSRNEMEEGSAMVESNKRAKILLAVCVFVASATNTSSMSSLTSFYPQEAMTKGMSSLQVGIILSCFAITSVVFGPFFGRLLPVIGTRFMLLSGLFILCGSNTAMSFVMYVRAGSMFLVTSLMCSLMKGIGFVSCFTSIMGIINGDFKNQIGLTTGLLELSTGVGSATGPVIAGALFDNFGFQTAVLGHSAFQVIVWIFIYFAAKPSFSFTATSSNKGTIKRLMTHPQLYFPLLSVVISAMTTVFFGVTIAVYTTSKFSTTTTESGAIIMSYHLTYAVLSPGIGIVIDKLPNADKVTLIIGHVISSCALIFIGPSQLTGLNPMLWLTIISSMLMSFGCIMMFLPIMSLCFATVRNLRITDDDGDVKAVLTTMQIFALNVGSLIGPILGGSFVDLFSFEETGLYFAAINVIAGLLNIFAFACTKKHPVEVARRGSSEQLPLL